jgi:hypothetical protein
MEAQGLWGVTNAELEQAAAAVDRSALLVPARIVRRVLRHDRGLSETGLKVPHRKTYFISASKLAEIVDPAEVGLRSFADLADQLILLARPEPEQLTATTRHRALLKYWRLLFHARTHIELDRAVVEERLTDTMVRERFAALGPTAFDEIRLVLKQENLLLPPVSELSIYIEFVAVYQELKYFSPRLLADYFPSLPDHATVDRIVGPEFDAAHWFAATRLPGSPEPHEQTIDDEETLTERQADPQATNPRQQSDRLFARLMKLADRAQGRGNDVGSAVMRWWAALRIGPKLAKSAREEAKNDIRRLSFRIGRALGSDDAERTDWSHLLIELLPPATRGLWTYERRFLYDLQKACVDHEQGVFELDLRSWLLSRGKRPLRRELPNQREVLIVKHLRTALKKLSTVRVAADTRRRLGKLLHAAVERAEHRVREQLRPKLEGAFDEVGLIPNNRPENVARRKLIEELLDRTVERGFLNMGDLRDAVSRNNLKLRDITTWQEAWTGDEALRADKALAQRLDGVYRAGEMYRRIPQWLSSVAFGTKYGRLFTRYAVIPFGGAYMLLEFFQHLLHWPLEKAGFPGVNLRNQWMILLVGSFILGLYSPVFRAAVVEGLRKAWSLVVEVCMRLPQRLMQLDWVRQFVASRAYRLLRQFVFKPLVTTLGLAAMVSLLQWRFISWTTLGGLFLFANLLINSRVGRQVDEVVTDLAARSWHHFRIRILGAMISAVMEFFHEALEWMERILYAVDEWLRFRTGETQAATAVKAVVGFVWFFVNYVIRFCVTLLIEPQINPIKHFPVVTVSHKILLAQVPLFASWLAPSFHSEKEAYAFVISFIWLIPGIFGFLVWELKENWRLYEANRSPNLSPVIVGGHGESIVRLLRWGFHSGTVPKTFAKLRKADRKAQATGSWQGPRKYHDHLEDVRIETAHFVERDFVALLAQSDSCRELRLRLTDVGLGTNHLRFTLAGEGEYAEPLVLLLAEKAGWLTARAATPAWVDRLEPHQSRALTLAIMGLFKLSGVELIYEQIDDCFAPDVPPYELCEAGLLVKPDKFSDAEVLYDLRRNPELTPLVSPATPSSLPTLDRQRLVFAAAPIRWTQWVEIWQRDGRRTADGAATDDGDRPWHHALRSPT